MAESQFRDSLSNVSQYGIPIFMAPDETILEQNGHLVGNIFPRKADSVRRRLAMCVDRTYLVPTHQLCRTSHPGGVIQFF